VDRERPHAAAQVTRAARARKLPQKEDDREYRYGERQYQPLKIVAFEPAGKVENEDDNGDHVKRVKRHSGVPLIILVGDSIPQIEHEKQAT
jgi:hypothetical protein